MNIKRVFLAGLILALNNNAYCAFWELPGKGYWAHEPINSIALPAAPSNLGALNVTGSKLAYCGRIYYPGAAASFTIDKAAFRFGGTVTKVGGSSMTVSLQDVSEIAGPPKQPDGTMDQQVDINNNEATFAANTWYTTGSFSGGGRTVVQQENVCMVIEYNAGGRKGSDSIILANIPSQSGAVRDHFTVVVSSFNAAVPWTIQSFYPEVVFEDSTGNNFATFESGQTYSTTLSFNLSSTSTPDEIALAFWNPVNIKINGLAGSINIGASNGLILNLYEGTTLLYSTTVSSRTTSAAAVVSGYYANIPETTLTANTTYYISMKTISTPNSAVISLFFDDPRYKELMTLGGQSHNFASRKSAGAWTIATSSAPPIAYRISAIETGSAAVTKGWTWAQ